MVSRHKKAQTAIRSMETRHVYGRLALQALPRLFSLMDRDRLSPTYGCLDREYWLARSTDFPSAIAQFGVHAMALVWATEFPDNRFYHQGQVARWCQAGIRYAGTIQHGDGSFDEFYPNERGWAGPTGFILYAILASRELLGPQIDAETESAIRSIAAGAGRFLGTREEVGVLANHHAMALLPLYMAADYLADEDLLDLFFIRWQSFKRFCNDEGWCLEYDGVDAGYLSATVSFLGKLRRRIEASRWAGRSKVADVVTALDGIVDRAVTMASHFVYPDGHYGGLVGSRQTVHFYPHGFEMLAPKNSLAAAMVEHMLPGFDRGGSVYPALQADRYVVYRLSEFLEAERDWQDATAPLSVLPCQQDGLVRDFPGAGVAVRSTHGLYLVSNLFRGGTWLAFDRTSGDLLAGDGGVRMELANGNRVATQWIDPDYELGFSPDELSVSGRFHVLPSKRFNPVTFAGFRAVSAVIGWNATSAEWMKGAIRRLLMTHQSKAPASFERRVVLSDGAVQVTDRIQLHGSAKANQVILGGMTPVRYVPQSRYFQYHELRCDEIAADPVWVARLNDERQLTVVRTYQVGKAPSVSIDRPLVGG